MNRLAPVTETLKLATAKPAVILAAAASLTSLAIASKAEALPPAVGQTTTLLKQGETFGKGTGVLVDHTVGDGVYCDGKSPNSNDHHVGSDMDDGANMGGNLYGHTAFLGLLSGQNSDAYYSIKAGWALRKEEDRSYSLYHFDTQNSKLEKDKLHEGSMLDIADMVGQKVASLSLTQLAVVGSGRWTDGHTDFEITPDEDSPVAPYQSMNQFYFRMHVQCASAASLFANKVPKVSDFPDVPRESTQEVTGPTLAV